MMMMLLEHVGIDGVGESDDNDNDGASTDGPGTVFVLFTAVDEDGGDVGNGDVECSDGNVCHNWAENE